MRRQRFDVPAQGGGIGMRSAGKGNGRQDWLPDQNRRGHEEKRNRGGDPTHRNENRSSQHG